MDIERVSLMKLFSVCFMLSALTIGGGYVIIGLLQRRVVEDLKWISKDEMLDIVAIAQASPGAIAVNAVNLVGWKLRGVVGAAVAVLGSLIPPVIIIIIVGMLYLAFRDLPIVANILKGMSPGVAAVILDVVITMLKTLLGDRKLIPVIVCAVSFSAAFFLGVNAAFLIIAAGAFGILYGLGKGKRS